MAYKKFISREGKKYGPYLYHSRRENGKVVSDYVGKDEKERMVLFTTVMILSLVMLGVIIFLYFVYPTGKVVFDISSISPTDLSINGQVKLILRQGELLPADSLIKVNLNDQENQIPLYDLVNQQKKTGNFFVQNTVLDGRGEGYGLEGVERIYPTVSFRLKITGIETTFVSGGVSAVENFTYNLKDGEVASIEPGSVSTEAGTLEDNLVNVINKNGKAIVYTALVHEDRGFGEGYLGNEFYTLSINISDFGITPEEGLLQLEVLYGNLSLVFGQKNVVFKQPRVSVASITVTNNVSITEDMYFNGSAFGVTVDGIIINGNGHRIIGNGSGIGIDLSNVDNITITNVTIMNFAQGIYLLYSWYDNITRVNLTGNNVGIVFNDTVENDQGSNHNILIDSYIIGNAQDGIEIFGSYDNDIENNQIADSGNGFNVNNGVTGGIYYTASGDQPANNTIANNFINNSINFNFGNDTILIANYMNKSYNCTSGTNIIGGNCKGGNYWSDYAGLDNGNGGRIAGDGIGDTNLPWHGDYFPLMYPPLPSAPSGGGGAGAPPECKSVWSCGNFSTCKNNISQRTCTDISYCETPNSMPSGCESSGDFECTEKIDCVEKPTEEVKCDEDWECYWSPCNENYLQMPENCVDLHHCGTTYDYPTPRTCQCTPDYQCGNWSACAADYSLNDLIIQAVVVEGKQERVCYDKALCSPLKTEYQFCSLAVPINIKRVVWCGENYIEVYEQNTGKLVSRLKESGGRLDISFTPTNATGVCPYCSDGKQDYDETGVDCGGSCPAC